jgi:hypothetical protein
MKINRKYIFHIHEDHIRTRLDVMVLYISSFTSIPKWVSFKFYQKKSIHGKNAENPYFIPVRPYSCSAKLYGDVHNFLEVLKKYQVLTQNPKVLAFSFTNK